MTVYIIDAHAHVQRLVSVVKMATVLEGCTIEELRSFMNFFLWARDSMPRILIKKCFLFTVGSVCHVKRFTAGSRNSLKNEGVAEVAETTAKRLVCCGFRRTGKAMGQLYQC
jgi:hypothetical protein